MIIAILFFGFSFLYLMHEVAHYFIAKKAGFKVESFDIGFGKSILSWNRNGTKWRICAFPYGGKAKIIGKPTEYHMFEENNGRDSHRIGDVFYSKKFKERLLVAICQVLPFFTISFVQILYIISGGIYYVVSILMMILFIIYVSGFILSNFIVIKKVDIKKVFLSVTHITHSSSIIFLWTALFYFSDFEKVHSFVLTSCIGTLSYIKLWLQLRKKIL